MPVLTLKNLYEDDLGQSKMLITNPDGSQKKSDMNNWFSLVGINFKSFKENEDQVLKTLKSFTDEGWKLAQVTPFPLSPSGNSPGIFMTRYLLSREELKKN